MWVLGSGLALYSTLRWRWLSDPILYLVSLTSVTQGCQWKWRSLWEGKNSGLNIDWGIPSLCLSSPKPGGVSACIWPTHTSRVLGCSVGEAAWGRGESADSHTKWKIDLRWALAKQPTSCLILTHEYIFLSIRFFFFFCVCFFNHVICDRMYHECISGRRMWNYVWKDLAHRRCPVNYNSLTLDTWRTH